MNELRDIESQLRSWKPRRPSANLKARIFGGNVARPAAAHLSGLAIGRWLAPAMALFVLGVVYLGTGPQYLASAPRWDLMATVDLSQPNLGTAYAAAAPSDRNIWDVTSFEWTNAGQTLSTIPLRR